MIESYAAYSKNEEERLKSSSGGIFSILAREIINRNGYVYGVAMSNDNTYAEFIKIDNANDLYKLRGSKYFQVKTNCVFKQIQVDLINNNLVLFAGTICQVNALLLFLGKKYSNLICIDVICHGVPSPLLWTKYIEFETKKKGEVTSVSFRAKDYGWKEFGIKKWHKGKSYYKSMREDPFMLMFLRNYCLRPSCYQCVTKENKKSDITIADFWGIENLMKEMDDDKGTSLIIIRNDKGRKMLSLCEDKLIIKEVEYEKSIKKNPAENKSCDKPLLRDTFFTDLNSLSFKKMIKKYGSLSFKSKTKIKIKKMLFKRRRIN